MGAPPDRRHVGALYAIHAADYRDGLPTSGYSRQTTGDFRGVTVPDRRHAASRLLSRENGRHGLRRPREVEGRRTHSISSEEPHRRRRRKVWHSSCVDRRARFVDSHFCVLAAGGCTTTTGQLAWTAQKVLTEPSSRPMKPPWPRLPTTSISASRPASMRTFAGCPWRTSARRSAGLSSPNAVATASVSPCSATLSGR